MVYVSLDPKKFKITLPVALLEPPIYLDKLMAIQTGIRYTSDHFYPNLKLDASLPLHIYSG